MEARVQGDLRTLFARHGIRPLAGWFTMVSPVSPAFVYVTPWQNMNLRSASWAGFYGDPEWAEVRHRTNSGSELVESYEIMFLRTVTPWVDCVEPSSFSELIIQTTAIGKTAAVAAELRDQTVPALAAAGAQVHGTFDIMSGRTLPALAMFVGWDSLEQRGAAMAKLDERSQALRVDGNQVLLERSEQHLLRTVEVDWG
jgi:NIPSNAP